MPRMAAKTMLALVPWVPLAKAKDKFGTYRMIIISIIVLATVITIVNYDRKTFIVQATGDS